MGATFKRNMYLCTQLNVYDMAQFFLSFLLILLSCSTLFAQEQDDHNFTVANNMEIFNAIYRNLDMM